MRERRGWRAVAAVAASLLLASACTEPLPGIGAPAPSPTASPEPSPTAPPIPTAPPTPTPSPAYSKLRVFVAAEGDYLHGRTGDLYVLQSDGVSPFAEIARIPMGGWPHNVAVAPNGRWVAVADRSSDQVGIVDPIALTEIARVKVGKQPHGIVWAPDSSVLYVGAEHDAFISRLEAGSWKTLPPLQVGVHQHTLAISADRPNELWYTVTMDNVPNHLRVYHLDTDKIDQVAVRDVHDAYFTPDGSEVWSSSSGFLDKPSDRMVVYDPIEKVVKAEIHFPGHYPFHTMKRFQDGLYFPTGTGVMLLSSHYSAEKGRDGASLLWVDWKARKIVDETPVGIQPYHSTYDPVGARVLVTSNADGMVNVIDWNTHKIVQKVTVPLPHGIVAVGIT